MDHDNHDDMSHDDHGGDAGDQGQGGGRLDAVSFEREQKGTGGADTLQAGEIFRADLQALNNSGVSGYVELARQGDHLTVRVQAEGLEANQTHVQHIHGRVGPNGEARDSNVPSEAFDTDGDGFVELAEGVPSYGPILLNLSSPQGAGAAGFPIAPGGKVDFEETYDLSSTAGFGEGLSAANLVPFDLREYVIHGLTVDGSRGAGTQGEVDGTAGYKLVLPVASAEFEAVGSELDGGNGDDKLAGGRGDDSLDGGDGKDELRGAEGDDLLKGDRGDDSLFGDAGADALYGGAGNDGVFGGAGADILLGGAGDDTLYGDAGPETARGADLAGDRLNGAAGSDQLWIGDGADSATGGAGMDTFGFRFSNPQTPLAAGTGPAFASITDFNAASDTLAFDVPGLGTDAAGANFAAGSGGVAGGAAASFYSGAASGSNGERVIVLTDQGFASGAAAVQAAQGEDAGDFVLYFNTTVNTGSLLVVSAPDTATSIARFTDAATLEDFQAIGFQANDFIFV
jgi:Ca2+-binding RTX toxin-like protein